MPPQTCTHGLVQRKKLGTEERDGIEVCRLCGLPTQEGMFELAARQVGETSVQPAQAEDATTQLHRQLRQLGEAQVRLLNGILVGVFLILALLVAELLFVLIF